MPRKRCDSSLRVNAVSAAIHGQAKPVIHDIDHEKVDCFVILRIPRNDGSKTPIAYTTTWPKNQQIFSQANQKDRIKIHPIRHREVA